MNSLTALFTGGTQTPAKVWQVEQRRGCSICSIWPWGLRNADEHGADLETQRTIRLAKCERAIRRLYHTGESLPTLFFISQSETAKNLCRRVVY
jgi:hypothetical protein